MSDVAPNPNLAVYEFPQIEGEKFSFDLASIPAEARLDFLRSGVRTYIANRLNGVHTRHEKDEKVAAWKAYDAAVAADPLQTVVAKPEGERPAAPNYKEALQRAFADLQAGNIRKQGTGETKARQPKDPLTVLVTEAVVREVFAARRTQDPKFPYLKAKAEVGANGIEYLNNMIEQKVAAGADRALLEKTRDEKYINPAKAMLGLTSSKKLNELPSLL